MPNEFGTVCLQDFDRGVVVTAGGQLVDVEVDGDVRQMYALECPGLREYPDQDNMPEQLRQIPFLPDGFVPVFFAHPEDSFQSYILPCLVVRRSSLIPNFERAPWWGFQRKPSCDANPVTVQIGHNEFVEGFDAYKVKWNPIPFDITYEVQVLARLQLDALPLLKCVLRRFRPPWWSIAVLDDQECRRLYDAGDLSISDISELVDVEDRTIGWNLSFTLRGELDLDDAVEYKNEEGAPAGIVTVLPEITFHPPFVPPPVVPPDC